MRITRSNKLTFLWLCYAFLISVLAISPALAIVNMDGLHFNAKKDSFSADFDFSLSGTSGNSNTEKTSLNAQFSWMAKKSINLSILGYKYGKSNALRNVNNAFVHHRYIYQLNNTLDWEIFGQLETNEFTRLSYRGLVGTGARFAFAKSEQHHAYFGLGGFYIKEEIEVTAGLTDDGVEELSRANIYFLSKYKVKPSISFSNVIYYQPRFNQLSDFRALLQSKFDFKINDKLSLRLSLDIVHDSNPSQTIKNTDVSYMSGFKFNF